jgi:hypothetical protein
MKNKLLIISAIIILVLMAGVIYFSKNNSSQNTSQPQNQTSNTVNEKPAPLLLPPIGSALERVTKKPFGIKISPNNSPVSPERFTGYHTGVDFEILPGEENIDVPIFVICTGPLLIKRWTNGYGGMVVQKCQLENQDITVVYGHLKIASVIIKINDTITAGEQIGILGKGYSTETDGERKHLHLGIHKGATPNTSGYIANSADLVNWINITQYLK